MLMDYGVYEGTYQVLDGKIDKRYYQEIGRNTYKVYKGSSDMSKKEFKKLLDDIKYEARELGIYVEDEEWNQ